MPDRSNGDRRPRDQRETATGYPINTCPSSIALDGTARQDGARDLEAPYAVLLTGTKRRRVLFGLPGAERALNRALARGEDDARLLLVRLEAVGGEV
ncbi:hypothetical protein [Serinibacter salmoneus]|uniref:Uncharacterized protein n=1 Tax=Serinibacter salmoneus TaxID=556530 RepID=A0A2A9CZS7_9MICO|nr:hypothetical protein [Serinibacter salmoneus]PFG19202.1 hypothetical protein ATL40_0759 [Serinibacter salmoneus]